jgi:hypothetical protein
MKLDSRKLTLAGVSAAIILMVAIGLLRPGHKDKLL